MKLPLLDPPALGSSLLEPRRLAPLLQSCHRVQCRCWSTLLRLRRDCVEFRSPEATPPRLETGRRMRGEQGKGPHLLVCCFASLVGSLHCHPHCHVSSSSASCAGAVDAGTELFAATEGDWGGRCRREARRGGKLLHC
jgi:hypothetical protein